MSTQIELIFKSGIRIFVRTCKRLRRFARNEKNYIFGMYDRKTLFNNRSFVAGSVSNGSTKLSNFE